ncbi:MgtC/SapB family protein [Paenibacillaceae bacterium]|nr:MgtC/SapB family protein [Paenibacillaceae bacterium]
MDTFPALFLGQYELLLRVLLAAVIGFSIGLERTHKSKPAGVKTYTFVTVASALITIISIHSAEVYSQAQPNTMMDPMRLTAQIVSGLGFIGAGLIIKNGLQVIGLTSAAILFFAGGVGIGIGAGFYTIVLFTMVIIYVFIRIANWIEHKEKEKHKKEKDKATSQPS